MALEIPNQRHFRRATTVSLTTVWCNGPLPQIPNHKRCGALAQSLGEFNAPSMQIFKAARPHGGLSLEDCALSIATTFYPEKRRRGQVRHERVTTGLPTDYNLSSFAKKRTTRLPMVIDRRSGTESLRKISPVIMLELLNLGTRTRAPALSSALTGLRRSFPGCFSNLSSWSTDARLVEELDLGKATLVSPGVLAMLCSSE